MMDRFRIDDLQQLIAPSRKPCASIYLPTHTAGREVREDPIRFKNLLKQVQQQWPKPDENQADKNQAALERILKPAWELQENELSDFWSQQSQGLAVFAAQDFFQYYRLPVEFPEHAFVGRRFHVKPLLPLIQNDGRFYILAVSQNQVRLLAGARFRAEELDAGAFPKNLRDALQIDEYQEALQFHSHTSMGVGSQGGKEAIYHGHGGSDQSTRKQDELTEYFRRLDDSLQEYFGQESAPLVFAGVEYLFPLFKEVCNYRELVDEPVTGNPDQLSAEQLHDQAWKVVAPRFSQDQQQALEDYGTKAAHNQGSDNIAELVVAAQQGRMETLLIAEEKPCWGRVDFKADSPQVELCSAEDPQAEDLVERAVVDTLLNSGRVLTVEQETLPGDLGAAGIFRYPLDAKVAAGK